MACRQIETGSRRRGNEEAFVTLVTMKAVNVETLARVGGYALRVRALLHISYEGR